MQEMRESRNWWESRKGLLLERQQERAEVGFEKTLAQISRDDKIGPGKDKCSDEVCEIFRDYLDCN